MTPDQNSLYRTGITMALLLLAWEVVYGLGDRIPIEISLPLRVVLFFGVLLGAWRVRRLERVIQRAALRTVRRVVPPAREFVEHKIFRPSRHAIRAMRLRTAGGRATREAKRQRWALYGNLCWVCHAPATHSDHVIAVARGGSNWPANIRPACRRCNCSKGAADWRGVQARAMGLPSPGRLP